MQFTNYAQTPRTIESIKTWDRGVITIPEPVREKLGIKTGTTVLFVEDKRGKIEIRTHEAETIDKLDEIGNVLREKGITKDQLQHLHRSNAASQRNPSGQRLRGWSVRTPGFGVGWNALLGRDLRRRRPVVLEREAFQSLEPLDTGALAGMRQRVMHDSRQH